ncbi:MAG: ABC transporter permease [Patescibacteria group bacterium]|jgi:ABC-2 type transport system permease protein
MKFDRIYALILRSLYTTRHSWDRITDLFYWPAIDLLLWGLTSFYIKKFAPDSLSVTMVIVSGVVLWLIIWRGQNDISLNLLEDLWSKNLINVFVSPIKFIEWVAAFLSLSVIKIVISLPFAVLLALLLYHVNIFSYGLYLIPFSILLLMTGWWVGMFVNGVILRYGTRVQTLAWSLVMIISPFSAIYYPLSILPDWAQKVAIIIPSSYIFEGAREVIATGTLDMSKVWTSLALNAVYLVLAFLFLKASFKKLLDRGLVKLY